MKWLVFESTLVGVRKRNKNKVNSRKSFPFFKGPLARGVVECFSSPLIPYGIQSVKIRRNRGIFDRFNSLFIFYSKILPKIQFHFSMGLDDLVLNIITLLNWQIPQQISWFGIRDSCRIWWIDSLLHFCISLDLVF